MNEIKTLPTLKKRAKESHKGDYGRVLVLAGSQGMTGAACLCAESALRAGAGLVVLGVPRSLMPVTEIKLTCCISYPLPETREGTLAKDAEREITMLLSEADVLAVGPGLSRHPQTSGLILSLMNKIEKPAVIDADALNIISQEIPILRSASHPVVLTPHPGEMGRLIKKDVGYINNHRIDVAVDFAKKHKVTIVLKGYQTVVTDGERYYVNNTGNPGMATAGSGDVLTGIIAAFIGQGLDVFSASQLGVYIHGLSGDIAASNVGEISLTADDIIQYMPTALSDNAIHK